MTSQNRWPFQKRNGFEIKFLVLKLLRAVARIYVKYATYRIYFWLMTRNKTAKLSVYKHWLVSLNRSGSKNLLVKTSWSAYAAGE